MSAVKTKVFQVKCNTTPTCSYVHSKTQRSVLIPLLCTSREVISPQTATLQDTRAELHTSKRSSLFFMKIKCQVQSKLTSNLRSRSLPCQVGFSLMWSHLSLILLLKVTIASDELHTAFLFHIYGFYSIFVKSFSNLLNHINADGNPHLSYQ